MMQGDPRVLARVLIALVSPSMLRDTIYNPSNRSEQMASSIAQMLEAEDSS